MMFRRAVALMPAVVLVSSACFATRNDVRLLQADVLALRAEAARADSARAQQMAQVASALTNVLTALTDSLRVASTRIDRLRGDTRTELYAIQQQLLQVQELTGQSTQRIVELRSELEQRSQQVPAPLQTPATPQDSAAAAATPTTAPAPGPAQLYQIAQDQLRRGSYSAARDALQELLRLYPTSDLAPDAQLFIAESYNAEGNLSAADAAYTEVITKFSASPRAATAMYKLGLLLARQGKLREARAMMDKVVREYPRTDEATLATDWLRTNR